MLKVATAEADQAIVINGYECETPRSPWRVVDVEPLDGYKLQVSFRDGLSGIVDLSNLVQREDGGMFCSLASPEVFRQVGVVFGAVTWANGVDIAPDAMHDEIERNGCWTPS